MLSTSKLMSCDSVLTEWKKHICTENFLERVCIHSIACQIGNDGLEIVPSSNPSSQIDMEDMSTLLRRDIQNHAKDEQEIFEVINPTDMKSQTEPDLSLHDEMVFGDYLSEFQKQLPRLHNLSSRLKMYSLKDPFVNSKGESLTEEMFFRSYMLYPSEKDFNENTNEMFLIEEDYKQFSQLDDESLMLPVELNMSSTIDLNWIKRTLPLSEIKDLLPLTTEDVMSIDSHKIVINDGKLFWHSI
ncbi:protein shortage in chiasmata 1 ortholog-like [Chiloscyllium plagiosum]|uniref:protein shortage in chiasmata 1 ortholog-like n=1 Tax=Chiloscyllium plagiosum TaxID=36176 RepID=UPI001CB7FA67|nr:protein shortage in chiasmata 1 ortholog-like [Chiloscyllium plagiosum]